MLEYLFARWDVRDLSNRIAEVHERAEVRRDADRELLQEQIDTLRRDMDELALFARTTATLMIERGICTDAEFVDRMLSIDRADGVEDGQLTPP